MFTLLREGDTEDLSNKVVMITQYLYGVKTTKYMNLISEKKLEDLLSSLRNGSFRFSPMYRSWIPKPNKPGETRPITQPHKKDIIVLDALSSLLNVVFESIFLPKSHGFIRRRGPITFFTQMGKLDKLIKADVAKCFDNIDHELLLGLLQAHLGPENAPLFQLIEAFCKTDILDKEGNNFAFKFKGIPQGCSVSPVLMNIYQHELDFALAHLCKVYEGHLAYARYADDIIIGIKGSENIDSNSLLLIWFQYFHDWCCKVKFIVCWNCFGKGTTSKNLS